MDGGAWLGCSPWGREESDMTEQLHFHFSLSCIGEGNSNHSSVLAWRIPETGEPGGLPSMRSHIVRHDWIDLAAAAAHTSKVTLKILQARLQKYVNRELPDVQAGFRKGRGTEIKLPTSAGSSKKQESSRRTSISALLTMPKPITVWITINCGNSERDGNTRLLYLPPEKSVCRSRSNS